MAPTGVNKFCMSLWVFLIFLVTCFGASLPAVSVGDCNVPFVVQYTLSRFLSSPDKVLQKAVMLKSLRATAKCDELSKIKMLVEGVKKLCSDSMTVPQMDTLTTALYSGLIVERVLNDNGVFLNVSDGAELSFSVAAMHLSLVLELLLNLESTMMRGEATNCCAYIKSIAVLLGQSNISRREKIELAVILRDSFPELRQSNVAGEQIAAEDERGALIGEPIHYGCNVELFQIIKHCSLLLGQVANECFKLMLERCKKIDEEFVSGTNSLYNDRREMSINLQSNLDAVLCCETAVKPGTAWLVKIFVCLVEQYRLLRSLKLASVSTVINLPFDSIRHAKSMGVHSNLLGEVVCNYGTILNSLMQLNHMSPGLMCEAELNHVTGQIDELQLASSIYTAFPNPILSADFDPNRMLISSSLHDSCWLPHAYILAINRVLDCPITSVLFEISVRRVFCKILSGVKAKDLSRVKITSNINDLVDQLSRDFRFESKRFYFWLIRLHIEDLALIVKLDLIKYAPVAMCSIDSLSAFIKAKISFFKILAAQRINRDVLVSLWLSFVGTINIFRLHYGLSFEEKYLFSMAKYHFEQDVQDYSVQSDSFHGSRYSLRNFSAANHLEHPKNTLRVSFIVNCPVPYIIQYALSRQLSGRIEAASYIRVLKKLTAVYLFQGAYGLEKDFETMFKILSDSPIRNINVELLKETLKASITVGQVLERNCVLLKGTLDLDSSTVVKQLKSIASLSSTVDQNSSALDQNVLKHYIRSCISLINQCDLNLGQKTELAELYRSTFSPMLSSLNSGHFKSFGFMAHDKGMFGRELCSAQCNDQYFHVLVKFIKYFERQLPPESAGKWVETIRAHVCIIGKQYDEMVRNGFDYNNLSKVDILRTPIFFELSELLGPIYMHDSTMPLFIIALLNCSDRYIELFRLLHYLQFKSINQIIDYPFDALAKAKALGITTNILEQLIETFQEFLESIWSTQSFIYSPGQDLLLEYERVSSERLQGPLDSVRNIFALFSNPSAIPDLKHMNAFSYDIFHASSWMPHAFIILAKRLLKCPLQAVLFEYRICSILHPILNSAKSMEADRIQVSLKVMHDIGEVCREFKLRTGTYFLTLVRRHIEDLKLIVKNNLLQYAPSILANVVSLEDYCGASVQFFGILIRNNVDHGILRTLANSFQQFCTTLRTNFDLLHDEEYVLCWASHYISKWTGLESEDNDSNSSSTLSNQQYHHVSQSNLQGMPNKV